MTAPTPAQQLAATLRAIADHLDTHPELPPVVVHWRSWHTPQPADLQISTVRDPLAGILAWARSLGVDTAEPRNVDTAEAPRVHLHLAGELPGGQPVTVWNRAPELDGLTLPWDGPMTLDALVDAAAAAAGDKVRQAAS